jgi:hypothetical protein
MRQQGVLKLGYFPLSPVEAIQCRNPPGIMHLILAAVAAKTLSIRHSGVPGRDYLN